MGCYPVLFFWLSISRLISQVAVHVGLLLGWVDGYFVLHFDCNGPDCEEQYNICKGKCSHMIENSKSQDYSNVGQATLEILISLYTPRENVFNTWYIIYKQMSYI